MSRQQLTDSLTLRADPATVRRIEQVAQRKDRTPSWVVRDAIQTYLRLNGEA